MKDLRAMFINPSGTYMQSF